MAESTTWLADAGFDAGGIAGALMCLGLVALIGIVTSRSGRLRRRPAGAPIHRRTRQRRRRRGDDSDWGDSGDWGNSGDSGGSGDSGSGGGSGCGGGGCGGGGS